MLDTSVNHYYSTDAGAPIGHGAGGGIIAVLDQVLVNGYGTVAVQALSHAGGVATVQSSGHGKRLHQVVQVMGAEHSDWNCKARVIEVVDTNNFRCSVPVSLPAVATGTITVKVAPLGWTKPYLGANAVPLAVYATGLSGAPARYLRVFDPGTTIYIRGYEEMTDVNTGTGPFPTVAQASGDGVLYSIYNTTPKAWAVVGDAGYVCMCFNRTAGASLDPSSGAPIAIRFGLVAPFAAGDTNACFIGLGAEDYLVSIPPNSWLARNFSGSLYSVVPAVDGGIRPTSLVRSGSAPGGAGTFMPWSTPSGQLFYFPLVVLDNPTFTPRGVIPGQYATPHYRPFGHKVLRDTGQHTLAAWNTSDGQILMDILGPWRT